MWQCSCINDVRVKVIEGMIRGVEGSWQDSVSSERVRISYKGRETMYLNMEM